MSDPTAQLVRVVTTQDGFRASYDRNPHEGMILCRRHLDELRYDVDPTCEEISAEQVTFWHHRCSMCDVPPTSGRRCENESCRQALHPQWPAVYCCDHCAREDA